MKAPRSVRRSWLTLSLSLVAAGVLARAQPLENWAVRGQAVKDQAVKDQFQPQVGQQGKDVVWVPTADVLVNKMLEMAKVTPQDYVMDLGSGDGRTVIAAAKRGARALGIEYNPDMVELSKRNAVNEGIGDTARFVKADLFESDFSEATVITMFLLPDINLRLRPKILDLRPGTRIVSNTFTMGEWTADETATVRDDGCSTYCTALLWIVPAKVAGTWHLPRGALSLTQSFQMVAGTLTSGESTNPITNGRLRGDQISFSVGAAQYTGRVDGNTIEGTMTSGGGHNTWTATRTRT